MLAIRAALDGETLTLFRVRKRWTNLRRLTDRAAIKVFHEYRELLDGVALRLQARGKSLLEEIQLLLLRGRLSAAAWSFAAACASACCPPSSPCGFRPRPSTRRRSRRSQRLPASSLATSPIAKSSSAMRTPMSLSARNVTSVIFSSCIRNVSVSSSSSDSGLSPVLRASALRTDATKSNVAQLHRRDVHGDVASRGSPASCHARACRQASSSTQRPIGTMRPRFLGNGK